MPHFLVIKKLITTQFSFIVLWSKIRKVHFKSNPLKYGIYTELIQFFIIIFVSKAILLQSIKHFLFLTYSFSFNFIYLILSNIFRVKVVKLIIFI